MLALFLILGVASPVFAGGLTVFSGKIDSQVNPGQEYHYSMKVQNTSDSPMDIAVESKGYGTSSDSSFIVLEPNDDTSLNTARELLSVSPSTFRLEPGDSRDIDISAHIPPRMVDGGKYAIVYIHTMQKAGMVATISAIAARVLLTIDGSTLSHSSKITAVNPKPDKPLEAAVTISHTGNHHYKPHLHGKLVKGDKVFAVALTQDAWPMIPGYSRQFNLSFISSEPIPADEYEAVIEVHDENETLVAGYTKSYKLAAACTPTASPLSEAKSLPAQPPHIMTPVSVTVNPSSAATLKTETDRISISFPSGAVISPAIVSLSGYPPEQLPSLPSDWQPTSTSFKVEGLNGLLAKEAVLTVNYSAVDLAKTGENASRLALARWDESSSRWTLLKTAIDQQNITLTTSTTQFSTFTVVILPPSTPINWLLVIIIGATILALSGILFFVYKRKRQL